jgi:hypothetical protein
MRSHRLTSPGGRREERGLVAYTERGRASIRPTTDGESALQEWENISEEQESALIQATASAAMGDWYTAQATLEAAGFSAGIR